MNTWHDLGGGRHKLIVTSDEPGVPHSEYKGTLKEIASMLANSQRHANRRLAELRGMTPNGHAEPAQQIVAVKPLTPDERVKTVAELSNPATVDTAVLRVVESAMGPLADERARRQEEDADRYNRRIVETVNQFMAETPQWVSSDHNNQVLAGYMQSSGMDPLNRAHYDQAFEYLTSIGLLKLEPTEGEPSAESEETDLEPNAPAPKAVVHRPPTRISTGVTSRDISGVPPRPNATRLKYSRDQLMNMGPEEYKKLMFSDGQELLRCEQWYTAHPVKRMA